MHDVEQIVRVTQECRTGCSRGRWNEKIVGMIREMTAAVLYGKEDLRLDRVAVPRPAAGEIVVQVGAALTCGTDLKVYRRGITR